MKRFEALCHAASMLEAVEEEPYVRRQEAEILLLHCLGIDKVHLYLDYMAELNPEEHSLLNYYLSRRLALEPVPYITGRTQFYGLDFAVGPGVLVPRTDSELLVEKVLEHILDRYGSKMLPLLIADVGTGSGCLAVSLATNLPRCRLLAVDISKKALETARINIAKHCLEDRIDLVRSDLLSACEIERLDIVVANLPYISGDEYESLSLDTLKHEPAIALEGGVDGLHQIGRLMRQVSGETRDRLALFFEVGRGQAADVSEMALRYFSRAKVHVFKDTGKIDRVVKVLT